MDGTALEWVLPLSDAVRTTPMVCLLILGHGHVSMGYTGAELLPQGKSHCGSDSAAHNCNPLIGSPRRAAFENPAFDIHSVVVVVLTFSHAIVFVPVSSEAAETNPVAWCRF